MALSQLMLAAALLAAAPSEAQPKEECCPCVCRNRACIRLPDREQAEYLLSSSSELFLGTVVAEELACCDSRGDITFQVERRWKGANAPQVRVRTPCCTEIYPFALGRQYLISATSQQGGGPAEMDLCVPPIEGLGTAYPMISALDEATRAKPQP